jgi:hypothetical protein
MSPIEQSPQVKSEQDRPEINPKEINTGIGGNIINNIESEQGVINPVVGAHTESGVSINHQEQSVEELYKNTVDNTFIPLDQTNEWGRVLASKSKLFSVDITATRNN